MQLGTGKAPALGIKTPPCAFSLELGMMYEMRLGFDGTMPGAPFADIYVRVWNLYQSGRHEEARDAIADIEFNVAAVRAYFTAQALSL